MNQTTKIENKTMNFRIQKADGTILNTGTGLDSWFTLDVAKNKVNYNKGERIVESDGVYILWEVL